MVQQVTSMSVAGNWEYALGEEARMHGAASDEHESAGNWACAELKVLPISIVMRECIVSYCKKPNKHLSYRR